MHNALPLHAHTPVERDVLEVQLCQDRAVLQATQVLQVASGQAQAPEARRRRHTRHARHAQQAACAAVAPALRGPGRARRGPGAHGAHTEGEQPACQHVQHAALLPVRQGVERLHRLVPCMHVHQMCDQPDLTGDRQALTRILSMAGEGTRRGHMCSIGLSTVIDW